MFTTPHNSVVPHDIHTESGNHPEGSGPHPADPPHSPEPHITPGQSPFSDNARSLGSPPPRPSASDTPLSSYTQRLNVAQLKGKGTYSADTGLWTLNGRTYAEIRQGNKVVQVKASPGDAHVYQATHGHEVTPTGPPMERIGKTGQWHAQENLVAAASQGHSKPALPPPAHVSAEQLGPLKDGTYPDKHGNQYVLHGNDYYQTRYDTQYKTQMLVDPDKPNTFPGNVPVRLDGKGGVSEFLPKPKLHGGGDTEKPGGSGSGRQPPADLVKKFQVLKVVEREKFSKLTQARQEFGKANEQFWNEQKNAGHVSYENAMNFGTKKEQVTALKEEVKKYNHLASSLQTQLNRPK